MLDVQQPREMPLDLVKNSQLGISHDVVVLNRIITGAKTQDFVLHRVASYQDVLAQISNLLHINADSIMLRFRSKIFSSLSFDLVTRWQKKSSVVVLELSLKLIGGHGPKDSETVEKMWRRMSKGEPQAEEDLCGLGIEVQGLCRFAKMLPSCSKANALTTLRLGGNRICGISVENGVKSGTFDAAGVCVLADFLRMSACAIQTLDLSDNFCCGLDENGKGDFNGEALMALSCAIASNSTMKTLILGKHSVSNGSNYDAVRDFASNLAKNHSLVTLVMKGKIPVALFRSATEETSIRLEDQGFTASEAIIIAHLAAQNSKIRNLLLSNNKIGGKLDASQGMLVETPQGVDALSSLMSNLTVLKLDGNWIGERGGTCLAKMVKGQSRLKTLSLADNIFGPIAGRSIAESLKTCSNLEELDLSLSEQLRHNKIDGIGGRALVALIAAAPILADIILTLPNFTTFRLGETLPISDLKKGAKVIDISDKDYGGEAGLVIAEVAKISPSIEIINCTTKFQLSDFRSNTTEYLEYNNNQIGPVDAAILGVFLRENTCLTRLDLMDNSLGGIWEDDGSYIEDPSSLRLILPAFTNVSTLHLQSNWIGPDGAVALASVLQKNSNLTVLNLRDNLFGKQGGKTILKALRNVPLVELDLSISEDVNEAEKQALYCFADLKDDLLDTITCSTRLVTLRISNDCRDIRHDRQLKVNSFFADIRDGGSLDDRDKHGRRASLQFLAENGILGQVPSFDLPGKLCASLGSDVLKWSCGDVLDWMTVSGLGDYIDSFNEANVDGPKLMDLDDAALEKIGIGVPEHRVYLLDNIRDMQRHGVHGQLVAAFAHARKVEDMVTTTSSPLMGVDKRLARLGRRGSIQYAALSFDMQNLVATPAVVRRSESVEVSSRDDSTEKKKSEDEKKKAEEEKNKGQQQQQQVMTMTTTATASSSTTIEASLTSNAIEQLRKSLDESGTSTSVTSAFIFLLEQQQLQISALSQQISQLSNKISPEELVFHNIHNNNNNMSSTSSPSSPHHHQQSEQQQQEPVNTSPSPTNSSNNRSSKRLSTSSIPEYDTIEHHHDDDDHHDFTETSPSASGGSQFHRKSSMIGQGLITYEGALTKHKSGLRRSFRRWFVLQGGALFYFPYPHVETDTPIGCIYMSQVRQVVSASAKNSFRIETTFSKKGDYVLVADSAELKLQWIQALQTAMDQCKE